MKKRFLCMILALSLVFVLLSGCGSTASKADYAAAESAPSEPAAMADYAYDSYDYDDYAYEEEYNYAEAETTAGETGSDAGVTEAQTTSLAEKIIYSASAQIETLEYEDSVAAVYTLLERFGGFLESSQVSGVDYNSASRGYTVTRNAQFVIRVPAENFSGMEESLSEVGNVTWLNTWTDNITAQFYDTQTRKEALETEADKLTQMLLLCDTVEEMIIVEDRLSEVQYEIDSLQSTLKNWQNQVDYSTITLYLNEVIEYTEPEPIQQTYWERLATRFGYAIDNFVEFFQDFFIDFVCALPTLAVLAVLVGIFLLLRRAWLKKHPEHRTRKQRRAEAKAYKEERRAARKENREIQDEE